MQSKKSNFPGDQFLSGGGEMGTLMRAKDWSNTLVGTPDTWPQSLRTTLSIILNSKFPMFLFWGPDLICFYNDAYRPSLGNDGKHPNILGSRGEDYWQEIWPVIKPLIDQVLDGGEATWSEDQLIPIYRNGKLEDVYWTFSYSPVNDESGKPAGVFVTCNETTDKVGTRHKLEESKDQLQFAIEAAELATWDFNPFTYTFTGNSRLKEWFGLPEEYEMELYHVTDSIAEKDRQRILDRIPQSLDYASGGNYIDEFTIIHPITKSERIVQVRGKASFNEDKIAYRLNGTLEDVTNEVVAQRKLEESERSLRLMIEQAPVAICVFRGKDHVVEIANQGMLQLWGTTAAAVVNKPIFEGLPEAKGQGLEQVVAHVFATGERFEAIERSVNLPRNGKIETTYNNFICEPLRSADGTVSGLMAIASEVTNQVMVRKKIEEKEEQLRIALEGGELGTFDYYPETDTLIWSGKTKEFFGLPADAEVNYSVYVNAIHPEDRNASKAIAEQQAKLIKGGFYELEYRTIGVNDGRIRWIRSKGKANYNAEGKPIRYTGVTQDITQLKLAEEKLRQFKFMADNASDPFILTDEAGKFPYLNKKALEKWGYTEEEAKHIDGRDVDTVVDNPESYKEIFEKALHGNLPPFETIHKHKSGATYPVEINMTTIMLDGKPHLFAVARDITERKKADQALRESEEKFRTMAESSDILIGVNNETVNAVYFNKAWEKLTGRPVEDLLNLGWSDLLHPDDREPFLNKFFTAYEKKESYSGEFRILNKDGKYSWLYAQVQVRLHPDGSYAGHISSCIDITERKQSEEEIKRFKFMADNASEPFILMTQEGTFEYLNKAALEKWGYTAEEAKSLRVPDVDPIYNDEVFANIFAKAQKEDIPVFETLHKRKDGTIYPVEVNMGAFHIGDKPYLFAVARDISERKKAEQLLKQSEQQLLSLIESAPFPIGVYVGREMRIQFVNESILKAWDKTYDAAVGQLYADVLPELVGQGIYEQLDGVFTTGIPFHAVNQRIDLVVERKLQPYYYNYSFTPLYNEMGEVYGILNTAANVTDLNIATQKIKESDKKFRNTVRQAPVGITILRGNQFMVEMANDAYLQLVDRKEEEFVGRPLFESLPEVKQTVYPLLKDVLDTGIPFHGSDYPIPVNRYGKEEISYFDFLYYPLKEDDGNISGIIVTVTDVSTSVKAKHLLQESENRFRNMVMQSPVAKAILRGEDHIIEMANPVMMEKIWRRKEIEVIRKKMLDVFPELKEQNQAKLLKEVFIIGKVHKEIESVVYIQGDDGVKKFYLDIQYSPLHEPGGVISGIMITANDVTERVEARQKVEENEERLRMAMQMTNLGTWEFNPVTGELNWSDECKAIYALPENEEVDFQVFAKQIHPEDKEYVETAIRQSLDPAGEGNYDIVYRILRFNDNSTRWIRAKGKVYFNSANTAEKFMGTVVDITDQKLFQQRLEENEQRSRLAIEAAAMGTFDWDLVTNNFISSPRLNEIFGFSHQPRITHQHLINAFHPEDKSQRDKAVKEAPLKGSLSYEARIIWPDKSIHWVRVYGKIIYSDEQQPLKMYGTVVDTTEEKTNLKALEDSTARLNIAMAASELGMWELNLLTRTPYYSDRYLEILGYKERIDLTHEQLLTHLHPDDLPIREKAFKKALDTGVLHYESRIIWNDQSIHWIEGRGKVFYTENNQPVRLMGTLRDITEEKFYQKELQDREQKFRLLADSMPEFVWTGDAEGNLNYFNQSVYHYSGLTPEQIDKDGWLQIVHPDEQDENIRKWMYAITTGTDFVFEHRFRKYDGEYRWQLSRAIPQKDDEGNIRMWVGTSTDIQDHKVFTNELERQVSERTKELEQKNKDLEKMNNELQSFAFVSSHDLQEPLRKIQTFGMLILENDQQNLTDNGKDYFHRMQDAAKRMQTLIEDLLSYSRTNTGDRKFETISINRILNQVKADLQEEIGKKNATIESGDLLEANVIAFQFRQLLTNLISNSLKFSNTERSPYIKIKSRKVQGDESGITALSPQEQYYHLTIEDNGIGFEPEHKDRIFQIFQRLHGKHKYPGTGIGLAIVKKIVENHNGVITATGHPNNGAIFNIYLPIASKQV